MIANNIVRASILRSLERRLTCPIRRAAAAADVSHARPAMLERIGSGASSVATAMVQAGDLQHELPPAP